MYLEMFTTTSFLSFFHEKMVCGNLIAQFGLSSGMLVINHNLKILNETSLENNLSGQIPYFVCNLLPFLEYPSRQVWNHENFLFYQVMKIAEYKVVLTNMQL